tara:strand:- start:205 stop:870 length:666 start_codon:yes stop_codon:yes gene_type:complete
MLKNHILTVVVLASSYMVPFSTFAQYSLVVSEEPSVLEGMTKFRLYIQLSNPTDQISAIFGTDKNPMTIEAPKGVFNSPFNGSWSASGLNPNFFEAMPSMVDDSFATIGLDGPASSGKPNSEDPIMVDDRSNPWAQFFKENEAVKLEINTLLGGSWFVLKTASNGLGDENLLVLIAQITTAGSIRGNINAQIFPLGDGKNSTKMNFTFDGLGSTPGVVVSE